MRFAWWINKATDTHTEYVTFAFLYQEWLCQRTLILSNTDIDCPVSHTTIAISLELPFHVQTIRYHILYDSNLRGQLWDPPGCSQFIATGHIYPACVQADTITCTEVRRVKTAVVNWTLGTTARRREVTSADADMFLNTCHLITSSGHDFVVWITHPRGCNFHITMP
jgi:hypothetical protein